MVTSGMTSVYGGCTLRAIRRRAATGAPGGGMFHACRNDMPSTVDRWLRSTIGREKSSSCRSAAHGLSRENGATCGVEERASPDRESAVRQDIVRWASGMWLVVAALLSS